MGVQTLVGVSTGTGNIGIGYLAGYSSGTLNYANGDYNIWLGYNTGQNIASTTQLTNAIAIGKNARVNTSNTMALGY